MDLVTVWDQVWVAWLEEKQDEVVDMSWCRVATHNRSLHAGFVVVHNKTIDLLG
jgi:hypothetical protein